MRNFSTFVISAFFLICSPLAMAGDDNPPDIRAAFYAGNYSEVIQQGRDLASPEGLSLAAEAMSAQVLLGQVKKRRKTATKARKLAQKALKQDPDSQEANVQYALARGFETQSSSPMRVWRKGLIEKSRKAIVKVQEDFPEDPRGDALMGAWHLGIVRRAGEERALDWFEATETAGIEFYESALTQSPEDIIILSNFATVLLAIDAERYQKKGLTLVKRAYAPEPSNALETAVQFRLRKLEPHFEDTEKLQSISEAILDDENDDEEQE